MKDQQNTVTESEPFGYQLQQLWDFSGILRSNAVEYIELPVDKQDVFMCGCET